VPIPDDAEIGMGGALLRYLDEGKEIIQIIFSRGEKSHPHLKSSIIAKTRKKESKKVADEIGITKLIYFNLEDTKLNEKITKATKEKLEKIIKKYKPDKIFTLPAKDAHPDHRAVNKVVLEAVDSLKTRCPVYTFQVWNVFTENLPLLQIDISKYFNEKIKIMKQHKSQWFSIYLQLLPVYIRAKINGLKYNCKYAEIFYKIR
jgi:LmbE family N-acetylglucosaminyl deacetylase